MTSESFIKPHFDQRLILNSRPIVFAVGNDYGKRDHGMKTHLTMRPGSGRKFLIPNAWQKISQNISFLCITQLFLFFMMKITKTIKEVTKHWLYLMYSCLRML